MHVPDTDLPEIRAGSRALARLGGHGCAPADIRVVPAAAGGVEA
jgi:hypothetical protein